MKNYRRLGSQPKAGRSHYQYKNWTWDDCGKRRDPKALKPLRGQYADLIHTCYYNRSKGTETLYCVALDLDAHRAAPKWKTKGGRLRWPLIRKFLQETHPELLQFIFAVVESTSGNGLAVYFAISPLELVPKTNRAQLATKALIQKLQMLFNRYDMGADTAAMGLRRDFCNWRNPNKRVYENILLLKSIQSERYPVVRALLRYLKPLGLKTYQKKSERTDLLYPDIRAERKLAKLYLNLLDAWLDCESSVEMSVAEVARFTGLCRNSVSKIFAAPPRWLHAEKLIDGGWRLACFLDRELTERALQLCGIAEGETKDFSGKLKRPEHVIDGERNHWITKATLLLKHHGLSREIATNIMVEQVTNIPGHADSKNCKNIRKIVRSIYGSRKDLLGVTPGIAPAWLAQRSKGEKGCLRGAREPSPPRKKKMLTFLKKGGNLPRERICKVSRDQCIKYKKNYYTLPKAWIGKRVVVFAGNDRIRIYDELANKHVYTHKTISNATGKYQVAKGHVREFDLADWQDIARIADGIESRCPAVSTIVHGLVTKHKLFALRRLWLIQGLIKKHGVSAVNEAAQHSHTLYQLIKNIEQPPRRLHASA